MSARGSPPLGVRPKWPAQQNGLKSVGASVQVSANRKSRFTALALSIAAHLMMAAMIFWPLSAPTRPRDKPSVLSVTINLAAPPKPAGPPTPAVAAASVSPVAAAQPTPSRPDSTSMLVPDTSDLLTESQLAGAGSAGEGGPGGGCDLAQMVQEALRRDPLVRAAVERAGRVGKAVMLWNGDWIRSGGQEGKGLSAVREAILWEVGFAPESCRNKPEHGLILLSLNDEGTRFAIGSAEWRWSDLLGLRGVSRAPR